MATNPCSRERFTVVLQPIPDQGDVPAVVRLRRALKLLLRSYGLRCIGIEPADQADSGDARLRRLTSEGRAGRG